MLVPRQKQTIITALVEIMRMVEAHNNAIVVDESQFLTDNTLDWALPRSLDSRLVRWNRNAVGEALREGVRSLGELFIPFATWSEIHDIIESVATQSPDPDRAYSIMDRMFDGLTSRDGAQFLA